MCCTRMACGPTTGKPVSARTTRTVPLHSTGKNLTGTTTANKNTNHHNVFCHTFRSPCCINERQHSIVGIATVTGWRSGNRIVVGARFSAPVQTGPQCQPSLLCSGYLISFPRVKRRECGVNHPIPSSAEVKERVQPYLYTPLDLYDLF